MFQPQLTQKERQEWLSKIETANRNNIFCHCRQCQREWIDSTFEAVCQCGSHNVETISCWQFPDD
jgi:Zn finger protein HypA/HybF involved in hydrogenase expression